MLILRLVSLLILSMCPLMSGAQSFTDEAQNQGLIFYAESDNFGNGVSFYDFDQDGWDDLTFTMSNDSLEFYRNNQGFFERLPSLVYGDGVVKHSLWVDYDNDGDMDLMISPYQKPYKLYQNDGSFNFTDVSVECGLAQVNENHYGVSFGDYNKDGFLDLYVCTYEFEGDVTMYNKLNHLYRNNGNGTFTDVTLEAGVQDGITFSFQSIWMDYDKDGWQDLLVINDRLHANSLYHNNTDGTFTNVAQAAGVAWPGQDPMTATVGDFDNDGDLDVFHSNTGIVNKHFRLWVNNDDGTFTESAVQYGLEIYSWTWGGLWVDFDNDSFQDLYVTSSLPNGALESNFFMVNQQGTGFIDGLSNFNGNHVARSFSAARGDINNDGFNDIAVQNQNPALPFLWQNSGGDANYIKITLQGTASNKMAIGSWIRVFAGGNQYTKYTLCGEDYVSQSSQHHIFGLSDYQVVDSITVEYLSGHIDRYYDLAVNQHYYFTEGDTYHATVSNLGNSSLCEGDSTTLYSGNHFEVEWNTGETSDSINVSSSGTYYFTAFNQFGVVTYSDTIEIVINPNPVIETFVLDPLCAGDQNGSAVIVNNTGAAYDSIIWSNNQTGDSLVNVGAGDYSYVFIDIYGCEAEGLVQLFEPFEMLVQTFTSPDFGNNDGSILIIINGGTPDYQIFLNGVTAEFNNLNLSFGTYELLIIDANGCEYSETIVIDFISEVVESLVDFNVVVYPNPLKAESMLNVTISGYIGKVNLYVSNLTGHLVKGYESVNVDNGFQIGLDKIATGSYLLIIEADQFHQIRKFTVSQ